MQLQDLQNIRALLERVPLTGKEAIAWCQAVAAVEAEIAKQSKANGAASAEPAAPEAPAQ